MLLLSCTAACCCSNNSKTHTHAKFALPFETSLAPDVYLMFRELVFLSGCLKNDFSVLERTCLNADTVKLRNINTSCILWAYVVLGCLPPPSPDVGTGVRPMEISMIGQIVSTGTPFPLLNDLSLSTANSGSSHRTPDCINILSGHTGRGLRLTLAPTAQTPPGSGALKQLGSLH